MLVQFTLKNFLSFKDSFTIDMTAINAYKEHSYNLIDIGRKAQGWGFSLVKLRFNPQH